MKRTLIVLGACISFAFGSFSAEVAGEWPGRISFNKAAAVQVLQLYREMTGFTLFTDSRVKAVRATIVLKLHGGTKDEAIKQVENALLTQTGVVVTHIDDKRVSVTYNDTLPTQTAGNQ